MSRIVIQWLYENWGGDATNTEAGYAYGAAVMVDGEPALSLKPTSGALGINYDPEDVYRAILAHLGHEVIDHEEETEEEDEGNDPC